MKFGSAKWLRISVTIMLGTILGSRAEVDRVILVYELFISLATGRNHRYMKRILLLVFLFVSFISLGQKNRFNFSALVGIVVPGGSSIGSGNSVAANKFGGVVDFDLSARLWRGLGLTASVGDAFAYGNEFGTIHSWHSTHVLGGPSFSTKIGSKSDLVFFAQIGQGNADGGTIMRDVQVTDNSGKPVVTEAFVNIKATSNWAPAFRLGVKFEGPMDVDFPGWTMHAGLSYYRCQTDYKYQQATIDQEEVSDRIKLSLVFVQAGLGYSF
jgi:hypothetical protein